MNSKRADGRGHRQSLDPSQETRTYTLRVPSDKYLALIEAGRVEVRRVLYEYIDALKDIPHP